MNNIHRYDSQYFLDSNAHVPLCLSDRDIVNSYDIGCYGHPLALSYIGTSAATAIEQARYDICKMLGISNPYCLNFTHSCTQANDWACQILETKILNYLHTSPFEHPSMIDACDNLFVGKEDHLISLPVDENGEVLDFQADATVYLGVQSEVGVISNLEKIRKSTRGYLISDLSQAVGKIPINLEELGVDIATFGAHKFGGPCGVGFLYLKDPSVWVPYGKGIGTSYARDIQGTPNVQGIITAALALKVALDSMERRNAKCAAFKQVLEPGLKSFGFDIICENGNRVSNTTFARVPKNAGALLLRKLSEMGVHVGLGSACGSFMVQESGVMSAFGKHESNSAFIRISQHGHYNNLSAVNVLENIERALKFI